ncbi:RIP metalloprotease RseP [candidate division NPL-UPA2 bacterium]|nr:RIP metalloprotease RseP [candidate division NPL-UPA2 bacterium]
MISAIIGYIIPVAFIFGLVIFVHEWGHFLAAKKMGVKVEKFSLGFGPRLAGFKRGDTEYLLSAIPLGGYLKMAGELSGEGSQGKEGDFLSKSVGKRAFIVIAGVIIHYLFGFFMLSLVFFLGSPTLTSRIGGVLEDMPAAQAGLAPGDKIIGIEGEKVSLWEEMTEIVHNSPGKPLSFLIDREGEQFELTIVPREGERRNIFGEDIRIGLIGITPSPETVPLRYGFMRSFYEGGKRTLFITTLTYKTIWRMLRGRVSPEHLSGPLGIIYITGQVARLGLPTVLQWIGLLSVALAIFNILPIPILDGGHLLFLGIEKIRGKPLPQKTREIVEQTTLVLLIGLILFVSYQDVERFQLINRAVEWGRRFFR